MRQHAHGERYIRPSRLSSLTDIFLKPYLKSLRAFFRFAEMQGWCAPGLAAAVVSPRLYAGETIPAGLA